jgi:hypothetical protein
MRRPIVALCLLLCPLLHQPFHQGAVQRPSGADRKACNGNDLQQLSTNCTRPENTKGGAISKNNEQRNRDKPRHEDGSQELEVRS